MYSYADIKKVHLEITSKCNASCPQCSRNFFGKPISHQLLPQVELTLEDVQKIFPEDFVNQLKVLFMSGTYGDPMVARDTLEVFEYFRACNSRVRLGMHTNGSGRKPEWWQRLASVVDVCTFGIDGLADTNHLYRRGTHWEKVMESVRAFIGAGGHAEWDYVVFRHNEHQVEEAQALARSLGFEMFTVKRTGRFLKSWSDTPFSPVLDREGKLEYFLEMPEDRRYRNDAFLQVYADRQAAKSFLEETPIACKAASSKKVYVSAEGLVLPCCWTATLYPLRGPAEPEEMTHLASQLPILDDSIRARELRHLRPKGLPEMWRLIDRLPNGKDSINAKQVPLKDIVEGVFFHEMVPQGWEKKSSDEGRLRVCAKHCGLRNEKGSQNVKTRLRSGDRTNTSDRSRLPFRKLVPDSPSGVEAVSSQAWAATGKPPC